MRIRQYAYLAVKSESLSIESIADRLGLEPDQTRIRASRSVDPPRPVYNIWEIRSDQPGLTIDHHLSALVERATPIAGELGRLASEPDCFVVLQVVRHFDDDGEEEQPIVVDLADGRSFEKLAGQHQLLGWHLEPRILEFLIESGCELDVDEYG